jgi:hypothetical protein
LTKDAVGCAVRFQYKISAAAVPYHEEYVEDSEGRRRHGEEVHRGNHFAMVPQECHPALTAFRPT